MGTARRALAALVTMAFIALVAAQTFGCGDGCDAAKYCARKNDALITSGKIIPICNAETVRNGTRYSWTTPSGTCSCTLDTSTATGQSFWRQCTFQ